MSEVNIKVTGANELSLYIKNLKNATVKEINTSLKEVAIYLEDKVKDKLGKYQDGWPYLKRETVMAKQRRRSGLIGHQKRAFSMFIKRVNKSIGNDDPLILFGKLHDSIKNEIQGTKYDKQAVVFTDNPYAAVHEYGYAPKNIPARSYMRLTLIEEEDYVIQLINNRIGHVVRSKLT